MDANKKPAAPLVGKSRITPAIPAKGMKRRAKQVYPSIWGMQGKCPSEYRLHLQGSIPTLSALRRAGVILERGAAAATEYEQNVIYQGKCPPLPGRN